MTSVPNQNLLRPKYLNCWNPSWDMYSFQHHFNDTWLIALYCRIPRHLYPWNIYLQMNKGGGWGSTSSVCLSDTSNMSVTGNTEQCSWIVPTILRHSGPARCGGHHDDPWGVRFVRSPFVCGRTLWVTSQQIQAHGAQVHVRFWGRAGRRNL